ncbi:MAG: SRPBCC family protein [Elusimicrobiota bacterium]|nr:SRPBCC family protein [Elusimicrobiota bacterium]
MTTAKPPFEIELDRLIDAPRERVFRAWSEPEQMKRWFAPEPFRLAVKSMDFRVGGRYEMAMRGPDGEDFPFSGVYLEVDPPAKLAWNSEFPDMPKGSIVTVVTFTEEGGKTRVRARQTFSALSPIAEHAIAGAKEGWNLTMDQLVVFAESEDYGGVMSAMKRAVEPESDREVVVTRVIDAPVARVWRAWTDNDEIVKWWGPHGFSDETESREFKPGGHWRHVMVGPDGTRFANYATYKEIEPMKRIVLVNGGSKEDEARGIGMRSEITFKPVGDKTEITMRTVLATAAMRERVVKEFRAVEGGQQTLARLDAQCTGQFVVFRLIDAPRERVWRAWTTEKELGAWMGPKGAEPGHAKLDLRVGGSFHYSIRYGGVEMWGLLTYQEVAEPERLVYIQQFSDKDRGLGAHPLAPAWPKRTLTTVHFQDFGAKTLVSLYWKPMDPTAAETDAFTKGMEGMKGGWNGSFERLEAHLKEGE